MRTVPFVLLACIGVISANRPYANVSLHHVNPNQGRNIGHACYNKECTKQCSGKNKDQCSGGEKCTMLVKCVGKMKARDNEVNKEACTTFCEWRNDKCVPLKEEHTNRCKGSTTKATCRNKNPVSVLATTADCHVEMSNNRQNHWCTVISEDVCKEHVTLRDRVDAANQGTNPTIEGFKVGSLARVNTDEYGIPKNDVGVVTGFHYVPSEYPLVRIKVETATKKDDIRPSKLSPVDDSVCHTAVKFASPRTSLFAGAQKCKCPKGTVIKGDDPASKDRQSSGDRKFNPQELNGKGCRCGRA